MLGALASADQLIDIPTARKIQLDDVRYEFRSSPYPGGSVQHFLGIGVGQSFELDMRDVWNAGTKPAGTFDFSYNLLSAIPGISPGISFGVQDAANLTTDGRRFYAVTTFRNDLDELPGNLYEDVTVGVQFGSLNSPFVGVALPVSKQVYLIAEHSGFRLSAGVEFRVLPHLAFRLITRDQETLLSLSGTVKF